MLLFWVIEEIKTCFAYLHQKELGLDRLCSCCVKTAGRCYSHSRCKSLLMCANHVVFQACTVCCAASSAVLSAIQSAEGLPALLLNLVEMCIQHLQQQSTATTASTSQATTRPGAAATSLPEALPGQAPGCGELLQTRMTSHDISRSDTP